MVPILYYMNPMVYMGNNRELFRGILPGSISRRRRRKIHPRPGCRACRLSLKSIWSDGTYQIVLSPEELLEKLAALVPPPRLNLVRYHGVLAPNAAARAQIVPRPQSADEETDTCGSEGEATPAQKRHRLA